MKPHNLQLHGQLSLLLCNIGMVCWNYDILYNDGKIPKPKWIIYVRTLVMIKFDCRRIEHTKYESPFLKTRRLALCTSFWICTAHDTVGSGHLSPGSSDWKRAWSASRSPLSWTPAPLEKPPLVCVAISILNKKKVSFSFFELSSVSGTWPDVGHLKPLVWTKASLTLFIVGSWCCV